MSETALSPSVMLATSMHAQPGVYAVLLGSGVSTGAGIPTGWGVVKELVRRAAAADPQRTEESEQLAEEDPERWWAGYSDQELGYADLLQAVAPTAAARQGILAGFFEPTDEDRDQGVKVPSAAHHAVAQLVKRGTVRVILTTNFDRLTEQALEAAGVSAQVISRPDAVNGMAPLAHSGATVVKLHGDYKDLRTLNTPEELSTYPEAWTTLLGQVFNEYGLLVAGWSADYDTALVDAIGSNPNRRYPLYWDSRSSKGEAARGLLTNRDGTVISSAGADELFTELYGSIEALDRLAQPHLTTAMALARAKRYLPDPVRRIDLHDLFMTAADEVATAIAEQPLVLPTLDGQQIETIWDNHLYAVTPLAQMLITGIRHDPDGEHDQLWIDVLQRLVDAGTVPLTSVTQGLDDARLWPALIATTAIGVVAVRRDRERLIIRASTDVKGRTQRGTGNLMLAGQVLHPNRLLSESWINAMPRWNAQKWQYPSSHLLKHDVRSFFEDLIPIPADYNDTFHGYEYRLGLIQENEDQNGGGYRALSGEYVGERGWSWGEEEIPVAEVAFREISAHSRDWPWPNYLEDADLDVSLIAHREILKRYRRFG